MEWNGGMDWTGTVEWNGMKCGKQLCIKAHAHTVPCSPCNWFVVLYHLDIKINIIRGGDRLRGLEYSFSQGTSLQLVFVYVIACFSVVFGINSTSGTG